LTYAYSAYGLTCTSNVAIAGFWPEAIPTGSPQLAIETGSEPPVWVQLAQRLGKNRRLLPTTSDSSCKVTILGADQAFELTYTDGAQFVVDGTAQRLWGAFSPPLTFDDFAVYLRGPIMGFILRRRGVIALHASALFIGGKAVVLCGPSQSGKSTTAAAMGLRGLSVLSDDIAAIKSEDGSFQIQPGYPRVCLWPGAVQELFGTTDALPQLTPSWEKRFLPLDDTKAKFKSQKCPLGAVYLLGPRTADAYTPRIEEISARQALLELVQNSYMNWLLNRKQRAAEFEVLSCLVTSVPVRRIVPHDNLTKIARLCDLIVADLQSVWNRWDVRSLVLSP
jgi:hypothetical protein